MKINQALKEKNRLAGKVKTLSARLVACNRSVEGKHPPYQFVNVLKELTLAQTELVDIKERVSKASQPIFGTILLMSEKKSMIATLKSLPVEGTTDVWDRRAKTDVEYEYQVTVYGRDIIVEGLEKEISLLQDDIDAFNATTDI